MKLLKTLISFLCLALTACVSTQSLNFYIDYTSSNTIFYFDKKGNVISKNIEEYLSSFTPPTITSEIISRLNDDGKFDLADVSVIAGTMGNAMKKGTQAIKSSAEEKARLMELKTLQPIFAEDLESADFLLPKFIRVADRDKKYINQQSVFNVRFYIVFFQSEGLSYSFCVCCFLIHFCVARD